MATGEETDRVFAETKALIELLTRVQENLTKSSDKNDALLEAIESTEARASESSGVAEVALVRNLRARIAATHAPNSALRRDLVSFSDVFTSRFKCLEATVQTFEERNKQVLLDQRDLEERMRRFEAERSEFESERATWREELDRARQDVIEQQDRLTVLSQQLAGTKVTLEARTNELASQRIAFEEERLSKESHVGRVGDSEAEQLRLKLKEQVLRNVELENALLRTELGLHQQEEAVKALDGRNERLCREVQQSRQASSRAVKQFEKRTAEANKKLAQMNTELSKAHEHARRFQELLATERRKQKGLVHALEQEMQCKAGSGMGDGLSPAAQKAYISSLSETLSQPNKSHRPVRIEDVIRRSELSLVENANLKAEIRKLRIENGELLRRVRFADINAHYMRNQVVTNLADRSELIKRLDKAEAQHRELKQSLTRQATDWVASKKKEATTERTLRWSLIEPIPVLGASERTWNCTPSKPHARSMSHK